MKKKKITQSERKQLKKIKELKQQRELLATEYNNLYKKFLSMTEKEQDSICFKVLNQVTPETYQGKPLTHSLKQIYINLVADARFELKNDIVSKKNSKYEQLKNTIKLLILELIKKENDYTNK